MLSQLTVLADSLASTEQHAIAESLDTLVGHRGNHLDKLRTDLLRFVFLLGQSGGEQLFEKPTNMTSKLDRAPPSPDTISRIRRV